MGGGTSCPPAVLPLLLKEIGVEIVLICRGDAIPCAVDLNLSSG